MKKIIGVIILTILFIILPLYSQIWFYNHNVAKYQVIGKYSEKILNRTGKDSLEEITRNFIRVHYENGVEQTISFDDPFIANTYNIGGSYIKIYKNVYEIDYIDVPFFVILGNLIFIMVSVVFILCCFVLGFFEIVFLLFSKKDQTHIEFWNM